MLVKLSARGLRPLSPTTGAAFVARLTEDPALPAAERGFSVLLAPGGQDEALPAGFRAYLLRAPRDAGAHCDVFLLGAEHHYLGTGDVVRIDPRRGAVTALFRAQSRFNSLLVTERCDN